MQRGSLDLGGGCTIKDHESDLINSEPEEAESEDPENASLVIGEDKDTVRNDSQRDDVYAGSQHSEVVDQDEEPQSQQDADPAPEASQPSHHGSNSVFSQYSKKADSAIEPLELEDHGASASKRSESA